MKAVVKLRLKKIFWPILYLAMIILVCVSTKVMFESRNYSLIFVSGSSMQPTLNNYESRPSNYQNSKYVDFGLVDISKKAIDTVQRFDIVTTLYPWDAKDYECFSGTGANAYYEGQKPLDTANYKIKRVIGLPGETLYIDNSIPGQEKIVITSPKGEKVTFTDENLPFTRKRSGNEPYRGGVTVQVTLGHNRYFVIGDNWSKSKGFSSDDCLNNFDWDQDTSNPDKTFGGIYKENITGVLARIQGFAEVYDIYYCETCDKEYTNVTAGSTCEKNHRLVWLREDIRDKHYF
jgi:signal peptidase I